MTSDGADGATAHAADGKVKGKRVIAHSMVDALEDILKWERASERVIKAAEPSN